MTAYFSESWHVDRSVHNAQRNHGNNTFAYFLSLIGRIPGTDGEQGGIWSEQKSSH